MVVIEPESVFYARLARRPCYTTTTVHGPARRVKQTLAPGQLTSDDFWTSAVFHILADEREAVRESSLVSRLVKLATFGSRAERDREKLMLFKLLAKLRRCGRLIRVGRNHLRVRDATEPLPARVAKAQQQFLSLPPPRV